MGHDCTARFAFTTADEQIIIHRHTFTHSAKTVATPDTDEHRRVITSNNALSVTCAYLGVQGHNCRLDIFRHLVEVNVVPKDI